jgi:hypothetical protein
MYTNGKSNILLHIYNKMQMMKQCTKCLESKDIDQFNFQKRKKENYIDKLCKVCRNIEAKKNNDLCRELINTLRTPCVKCGEKRKHLIDFHHLNKEEKEFNIANYAISGAAKFETKKEKIMLEVLKCITLCSNCHRDFHFLERTKGIKILNYI